MSPPTPTAVPRPQLTLHRFDTHLARTEFPKTCKTPGARALYFLQRQGFPAWTMDAVPRALLRRKKWSPEDNPFDGAPEVFAILKRRHPGRLLAITVPTMARSNRAGKRFQNIFDWWHDLEDTGAIMLTMWQLEDLEKRLIELGELDP